MLIRAKKHVLSSYSYSNLSLYRKITKDHSEMGGLFLHKNKRPQAADGRPQKTRPMALCVGADLLTSQTTFGGQLPYKGSLVRPAAIFDHGPFGFNGMFFDYE